MSWRLTFGIALLTSIVSAAAAGYLASLTFEWRRDSPRYSDYCVIFIGVGGLLAGFLIGAIMSRRLPAAGFLVAQASSLAIVAGICLAAGIYLRMFGEVAPRMDGDTLTLEIELKCPRGWQPDNRAQQSGGRGNMCLHENLSPSKTGPRMVGFIVWKWAVEAESQWTVRCEVGLHTSLPDRFVEIRIGNKTDVAFALPLPAKPVREHLEWSEWSKRGFGRTVGQSADTDYEFRYRVRKDGVLRQEREAAEAEANAAKERAIAAANAPGAPMEAWLPFFEKGDTGMAAFEDSVDGGVDSLDRRAKAAIRANAGKLGVYLQASSLQTVRRAVFAAAQLYPDVPPAELIGPRQSAGQVTIVLIQRARVNSRPDDEDTEGEARAVAFFERWNYAMRTAGAAAVPGHLRVLNEILKEAGDGGRERGVGSLVASAARSEIDRINAGGGDVVVEGK